MCCSSGASPASGARAAFSDRGKTRRVLSKVLVYRLVDVSAVTAWSLPEPGESANDSGAYSRNGTNGKGRSLVDLTRWENETGIERVHERKKKTKFA